MASIEDLEERIKRRESILNFLLQDIDSRIETKLKIEERQILRILNIERLEDCINKLEEKVSYRLEVLDNLLPSMENLVTSKIKSVMADYRQENDKIIETQIEFEVDNALTRSIKSIIGDYCKERYVPIKQNRLPLFNMSEISGLKEAILNGRISLLKGVEEFEREIILEALKRANNIQTHAAEILGFSRRILKYKMDKLGIEEEKIISYAKHVGLDNSNIELISDKDINEKP